MSVVTTIFPLRLCPIGDYAPAALLTLRSPLLTLAYLDSLSAQGALNEPHHRTPSAPPYVCQL
jgi:hypothetical protein